jgi:Holliday junction resolvase
MDMLELLALYAEQHRLPIYDAKTTAAFLEDARKASEDRLKNEVYLHGKRTEAMFETVVATLGEVHLIKQEDAGFHYYTGLDLKVPDLRIVTKNGDQLLVEVKNHRQNQGLEPHKAKCDYIEKLARYAELTKGELLIATYWSRWNRWSLVPPSAFERSGNNARLSLERAVVENHMGRLGDRVVGTRWPLRLRMQVQDETGHGAERTVVIKQVDLLSEDRVLTDSVEKRLGMFLLLEGGWEETTNVEKNAAGEYEVIEFSMAPPEENRKQNEQGFDFVDALSGMISRQFNDSTTKDGTVNALRAQFEPGEIRRLLPDDYPYGKGALPIWVMEQRPHSKSEAELEAGYPLKEDGVPKYDKWSRWFIAKCFQQGMAYEEFAPLAKRLLDLDVPRGTYDSQKAYLLERTPEEMGDEPVVNIGSLGAKPGTVDSKGDEGGQ